MQRRPQARSQEVQIGKCKLVFENNLEIWALFFSCQEEQVWYSKSLHNFTTLMINTLGKSDPSC